MTQISFSITQDKADQMTWEEMEALLDGNIARARRVMARFLVDEKEQPVEFDEAMKTLGNLKMSEIKDAVSIFAEAMKNSAVNPTSASK